MQNAMDINEGKIELVQNKDGYMVLETSRKIPPISALAKKVLIKGENRREFEQLESALLRELAPHTKIENILCEKFIIAVWKLNRAMVVEKILLNGQNAITDVESLGVFEDGPGRKRIRNIKKVNLTSGSAQSLIKYQLELEKSMQEALEDLRKEQAMRKTQAVERL